jgi:hypothetical protein
VPPTLTRAVPSRVLSTASRIKSARSLSATHSRTSGGKIIGVSRSTLTYFVAIPLLYQKYGAKSDRNL